MAAGRSIHVADGDLERLRRQIVDVIDVVWNTLASCPGDATATTTTTTTTTDDCHDIVLFSDNLRNGDDDHHRRRG